jgi:hypothetical protein
MNWNSKSVSEVSKEKIWKEHVRNESSHIHLVDTFRKNPFHVVRDKQMPANVTSRPSRFLDRERVFLETIDRRIASQRLADSKAAGANAESTSSGAAPALELPNIAQHTPKPPPAKEQSPPLTARPPTNGDTYDFGSTFRQSQLPPAQRYTGPKTEAQEMGWFSAPVAPKSKRFTFNIRTSEMSRFATTLQQSRIKI